jgi:MFS family permease
MYGGRIIVGLGIGIASNLAVRRPKARRDRSLTLLQPIYVAEIAPPAIRGRLIGMYELCWQLGGVIGKLTSLKLRIAAYDPRRILDQLWRHSAYRPQPQTMVYRVCRPINRKSQCLEGFS